MDDCPESLRLGEDERREKDWKRWGPYLSERQWKDKKKIERVMKS